MRFFQIACKCENCPDKIWTYLAKEMPYFFFFNEVQSNPATSFSSEITIFIEGKKCWKSKC